MHLPGRLSSSTLGDLLGALYRGRITGTIELSELAGPRKKGVPGRLHRLHLRGGLVVAIDTALPTMPLGSTSALREQIEAIFSIEDATVAFRTARTLSATCGASPLGPADFLHGRPRLRDRAARGASGFGDGVPRSPMRPAMDDPKERARRLLGVGRGAGIGDVRRAFRRMAGALHPDRLGPAAAEVHAQRAARFAELSAAYHLLVA
jgi:hypothetical protein